VRRLAPLAIALVLLAGACTDPDEDAGSDPPTTTEPETRPTTPQDLADARITPLLIRVHDLQAPAFEDEITGRRFTAEDASRILLCGDDLRTRFGVVEGRQSRFRDGDVEVSHTVTSGGDGAAFLDAFEQAAVTCAEPWTEPPMPAGGGPVERRLTGSYPVPEDVGLDGAGAIIRSSNELGATDTIVVVLAAGPLVSTLSVSGPIGADFSVVDPAIEAAARRLRGALGLE
jgi:hypothetical protein